MIKVQQYLVSLKNIFIKIYVKILASRLVALNSQK